MDRSRSPLPPLLGSAFIPYSTVSLVAPLIAFVRSMTSSVMPGCGYGFDLDDEWAAAWSAQDRLHSGLARFALAAELYGVNAARGIIGEAPDLRALLLAPSTGAASACHAPA